MVHRVLIHVASTSPAERLRAGIRPLCLVSARLLRNFARRWKPCNLACLNGIAYL
jgi:hypothetical protein